MAVGTPVVVLVFVLAVPVVLYLLVRSEHHERETLTREEAERSARRDTGSDR